MAPVAERPAGVVQCLASGPPGSKKRLPYAKQDTAKVNDVPGATRGLVDMFDTGGKLMARVATKGALDAPWGLALAPSDFGPSVATCWWATSATG